VPRQSNRVTSSQFDANHESHNVSSPTRLDYAHCHWRIKLWVLTTSHDEIVQRGELVPRLACYGTGRWPTALIKLIKVSSHTPLGRSADRGRTGNQARA
jgi:hypothetical protein